MVKTASSSHRKPDPVAPRDTPKVKKLLREMESLIKSDDKAASRLVAFVKEKGRRGRGRPPLDAVTRKSFILPVRLTGEPRYADEIERTLFNQLLAAQLSNGRFCKYTPLLGRKQEAHLFRKMNYLKYKASRLRAKLGR